MRRQECGPRDQPAVARPYVAELGRHCGGLLAVGRCAGRVSRFAPPGLVGRVGRAGPGRRAVLAGHVLVGVPGGVVNAGDLIAA